ncbi:MAG TPA: hypothetical protein DCX07_15680 [Phycisphaerales bacterium]|nr:hypothetical protein [Phycisphaerales bacterium]
MPIDFTPQDWKRTRETYRKWWAGELDRPLFYAAIGGKDPGRAEAKVPNMGRTARYPFSISAEDVVDRWDYDLSCRKYVGDGFPSVWLDFGPGVLAAFLGAQTGVDENTVWFHPAEEREIPDIHFSLDLQHPWLQRIESLIRAAQKRWGSQVQLGMTDMGGNLDILSTFRPSEKLLLDLYDHPDEVKRLTWEAHEMWWKAFDHLNRVLQPVNPGYTAWVPIFSEMPYYMLQCDFCYMIGTGMFDEFVKPELAATCKKLAHPFYHLDGPGQLAHLDSLLAIPGLRGVQWIPGAGAAPPRAWPEVYRKIRDAGKLMQVVGDLDDLRIVIEALGDGKGIYWSGGVGRDKEHELMKFLEKYGAA